MTLYIALFFVGVILYLQYKSFSTNKKLIKSLESFFPSKEDIKLTKTTLKKTDLESADALDTFLDNPRGVLPTSEKIDSDEDLLILDIREGCYSYDYEQLAKQTNKYLCKNVGTSADLNVIEDICEHNINAIENQIQNNMNVPLYFGLGGTFIGIIIGLSGLRLEDVFQNNNFETLNDLVFGVIAAMIASTFGLGLMIRNSAYNYKNALEQLDFDKSCYYDKIREDLQPTLSNSMSKSLNSLKGVLGNFVDNFGKNLDAYTNSAQLLNDNLEKQHLVLEKIQQLNLTQTATTIAETFMTLKESASSLQIFKSYQDSLNDTIKNIEGVTDSVNTIVKKFDNFGTALMSVANSQQVMLDLQSNFQTAMETHFPTGSEARAVWRQEYDLLMEDAKNNGNEMARQLSLNTQYISKFVEENQEFYNTFSHMTGVLQMLTDYTKLQSENYQNMKQSMDVMTGEFSNSQTSSMQLQKEILESIKHMNEALKEIKRHV